MATLLALLGGPLAWMLKLVLGTVSGPVLDKVLGHIQAARANEVERLRVTTGLDIEKVRADVAISGYAAATVQAGMQHRMFWVPWSMAAIPMAAWFGWGMLDTLFNGALPDVASIPPGLEPWAAVVWQNIFYTGAGVAGVTGAAAIIGKAIARR